MKRLLYVIPVAIVGGLMWAFAVFLQQGPPGFLPSQLVGKATPDFTLPPLDAEAQNFTRAELAEGRPTVINFFASWCTPCRVEHPTLQAMAARGDITLYGIDYKDDPEKARAFLTEVRAELKKVTWPSRGEVYSTTLVVIATSIFFGFYLWGLDLVFSRALSLAFKRQF